MKKHIKIWLSLVILGACVFTGLLLLHRTPPQVSSESRFKATVTSKITSNTTTLTIVHSHDGLPMHKHVITIVTTVNETTFPAGLYYPTGTAQLKSSTVTSAATQNANEIRINSGQLSPTVLTVAVGTRVSWTSKDNTGHTITSDSGIFNGFLAPNNGVFSYTFNKAGTYSYYCELNPSMKGSIVVTSLSTGVTPAVNTPPAINTGIGNTSIVNTPVAPTAGTNTTTTNVTEAKPVDAGSAAPTPPVNDGGYVSE